MKRKSILSLFTSSMLLVTVIACMTIIASAKQYTINIERQQTIQCTTKDTVFVQTRDSYYRTYWDWDDDDAADISEERDGVYVEPYRSGYVTIYAEVEYDDGDYETYECEIRISSYSDDYFEFSKTSYDVEAGDSFKLSYDYGPYGDSSDLDFTSSDTSIATVSSSGKVTGKRAGTVTITGWYGNASDTCKVYVDDDIGTLELSSSSVTLEVGDEKHIKVTSWDDDELRWTSSNEKVATVDSDGYVTAKKEGTATITAEVRGSSSRYGTCKVTVKDNDTGRIDYTVAENGRLNFDVSKFNTFSKNLCGSNIDSIRFTSLPSSTRGTLYYRYDSSSDRKTVSNKDTYYSSGSNGISDLTFIPKSDYTGTVEYEFTGESVNGKNLSGVVRIDVSSQKTGTFDLSPSSVTLEVGDEKHIKSSSWDDDELRWTSSNEKVATVDSDGYVTAKKEGTATITAEVRGDSKKYGVCKVTVGGKYKGSIDYAVSTNGRLNFDLSKFNSFSKNLCSSDIDSIRFTSLPSTTRGTLYYRYDSTVDRKTVSTKDTYYSSGSGSISDLTFIPQLNYTGAVEYEFTAESKSGKTLTGVVKIDVSSPKEASIIIYTTTGTLPVRFRFADFEKACSARSAGSLSSIRFTLPSSNAGMLYYNYLSPLRYSTVSSSVDYGLTGNMVDGVSFVPASGSSGRVSIQYTGTDKNGASYNGTVEIAVTNSLSNVSKFNDVKQTDYFAQPVSWTIEKGITKGTSAATFSPNATCTRVQILTFLWRAYGSPAPTIKNPFSDLPNNKDYQSASLWAFQNNLISSAKLNPDAPCTRSEVARYLWILAGRPSADKTQFTDVPSNSDYAQAVSWAYAQGVTDGTSASTFAPSATCTRGQIVTFLWRYVGHQVLQ